jgi:hypothetical protein
MMKMKVKIKNKLHFPKIYKFIHKILKMFRHALVYIVNNVRRVYNGRYIVNKIQKIWMQFQIIINYKNIR